MLVFIQHYYARLGLKVLKVDSTELTKFDCGYQSFYFIFPFNFK